ANYTIPRSTPFALTATGSDPNGDTVSYTWEEFDLGSSSPPDTDADGVARPIFRSYLATSSPTRTFPSMQYILNNANVPPASATCPVGGGTCLVGEALPTITRTMNFRVTARDNRTTGAINSAAMQVSVSAASGPFNITSPNTNVTWANDIQQTVTWNVAGTTGAPVNASTVRILLSTDGGNTFPVVLSASTPNDGSEPVLIPVAGTTTARIKVEAVGNIFFDISDTNFTITGIARKTVLDFDGDGKTDPAVVRNNGGAMNWYVLRSTQGFVGQAWGQIPDRLVPADYDGDGKWDIAVWRPGSPSTFYILRSSDGALQVVPFGQSTDDPRNTQDFDGDGKADPAVVRNVGGSLTWYINRSLLGFTSVTFGNTATDQPLRGDYDGDGKADIAIYRNSNGSPANTFYVLLSSDGAVMGQTFGLTGSDNVLPCDFDGDGKTDFAVYRYNGAGTGSWYWLRSSDGGFASVAFGAAGDLPAPGDYDGDGRTDQAVWRGSNGTFYLNRSTTGFTAIGFGTTGDQVVSYDLQAR
ncbi:MAG: VCBS repeat-containing protein, partial [Acidobacteria bacterium]|nr:VCBS repeat-containing protein [Acidobacteriota bacterium]